MPIYVRFCAVIFITSTIASAQTNDEINAGLQFSFAPPGARSLALGGAFTGLADDSTAAFANPAGLIWIYESEVSTEGRYRNYKTKYPFGGSANFTPTNVGIDTNPDLELREFESAVSGLSFLSYAHVLGEKWRVALYRHELAAFEVQLESQGSFIRKPVAAGVTPTQSRSRLSALSGRLDLDIVNYGASAAYSVTENLWLGIGLSYYTFDYDSLTRRYATNNSARSDGVSEVITTAVELVPANETERSTQTGDDSDVAATVGLIWKGKSDRWGLGLVYRQAPEFDFDYGFNWGPLNEARAQSAGQPNPNLTDPGVVRDLTGTTQFAVPDVVSVGWMVKPTQKLTVSFEYDRVEYSSLTPAANVITTATRGAPRPGTANDLQLGSCGDYNIDGDRYPTPLASPPELRSSVPCISRFLKNFKIDDGDEFHLGVEYVFVRQNPIALRFGLWYDPDHQLYYDFEGRDPDAIGEIEDRFAFRFPRGEDELHITGGLGFVGKKVQVDLAFDLSERSDIVSLSMVYRFGGATKKEARSQNRPAWANDRTPRPGS